jgi:uncharacterized integral membrane protein
MSDDRIGALQDSPVPGVIPATMDLESAAGPSPHSDTTAPSDVSVSEPESGGARFARRIRRVRLYMYAFFAVALLVYVVALAGSNTHHVRVDWVFGSSSVSLVWLVLLATILGWLLGLVVAAAFRWRTRAPRSS